MGTGDEAEHEWTKALDALLAEQSPPHPNRKARRMSDETDYLKYRGKCKELAEAAVVVDPSLILVRGHYFCPIWGEQPHWWCKRTDGTIIDPSKDQFPSKGIGAYVEFDGIIPCSNCGKEMREGIDEIDYDSNYAFCSYRCHGQFVGVLL